MDFVGLGCDRICEVSYKLIGHLIYDVNYLSVKNEYLVPLDNVETMNVDGKIQHSLL